MRNKNLGVHRSSALANVAYKQSWREILTTNSQGRSKPGKSRRMKGRPVGNDVPVEILKNRIPTVTCKSLRKRRSGFRTFSTSRAAIHYCNSKGNSYDASKNAFLV
jgi:hypothetical protein